MALAGDTARIYLDNADEPVLVVLRLAGVDGTSVGVWAGNFRRGAYFSNYTVTASPNAVTRGVPPVMPPGSLVEWERSHVLDASTVHPGTLPSPCTDGVTIYLNGQPLFFGMNPPGLRDDLGLMPTAGDAVYLPLERGRNELVMAVTEYTGGWAFWARIDGRPSDLRAH